MTPPPARLVVDAGVGIKLFPPEEHSAEAKSIFPGMNADPSLHAYVPDLFYAECANILWKYVRRGACLREDAVKDIADLKDVTLRVVPTAALMPGALKLALKWDISAYDACYLALVEELKAPLVTADPKLFRRHKGGTLFLKWIGDYPKK